MSNEVTPKSTAQIALIGEGKADSVNSTVSTSSDGVAMHGLPVVLLDQAKQRDDDSETNPERPEKFFLLFLDGTCGEDFDEDGEEDAD